MIKVLWFLKRAEHLSLAEFRQWWLERHAPDVERHQRPYLTRYVVRVRSELDATLAAGRPTSEPSWDGVAEQWFDSAADYNAVYGRAASPTRGDTLANTSRFERLVFEETEIPIRK
jgi:hypothetical protein